ncbi:hypothetical protein DV736_g3469, partial [Chaetothyriales sp. CBS 134916]
MSSEPTDKAKQLVHNDGIVNPSGALMGSAVMLYIIGVPISSYITKPGGIVQSVAQEALKLIPGGVAPDRTIPALAALYTFVTFVGSASLSVAGQAMSRAGKFDNHHPRKHVNNLDGLPLRLRSAHYGLIEHFSSFAVAASLAQILSPRNQQITNLLGLHVVLKVVGFYVAYVANIAPLRSISHVVATSAVVNVLLRLANGA